MSLLGAAYTCGQRFAAINSWRLEPSTANNHKWLLKDAKVFPQVPTNYW